MVEDMKTMLQEYAAGGLVSKNAMSDYFLASSGRMTEVEFVGKHKMSTLEFEKQFAEDNSVDISGTEKLSEINTTPKGVKMDYSKKPKTMAMGGPVERDPVSGNEVPPGSSPEEVRDDIPAMLSEGEYIIPADVLKFFGVNFFEKLRIKAKQGMMEMEEDDRVGGDPLDGATMEPEEPPMMAEGGLVEQPTFNPADFSTPGMSVFGGSPSVSDQLMGSSAYTYKEYFGPAGDSQMILYINGEPAQAIPAGYSETAPVAATPGSPGGGGGSSGRSDRDYMPGIRGGTREDRDSNSTFGNPLGDLDFTDSDSINTWAEDKLKKNIVNTGMSLAGGLIGGAASTALELRNIAEVSAAARYYEELGDQESSDRLMGMADEARGNYGLVGRLSEGFSDGERIFERYMTSLNTDAASISPSAAAGRSPAPYKNDQGADTYSRSSDVYDVKAGGSSGSPKKGDTVQFDRGRGNREDAGERNARRRANKRAAERAGVTDSAPTTSIRPRGRNKGGLVSRPKK